MCSGNNPASKTKNTIVFLSFAVAQFFRAIVSISLSPCGNRAPVMFQGMFMNKPLECGHICSVVFVDYPHSINCFLFVSSIAMTAVSTFQCIITSHLS